MVLEWSSGERQRGRERKPETGWPWELDGFDVEAGEGDDVSRDVASDRPAANNGKER